MSADTAGAPQPRFLKSCVLPSFLLKLNISFCPYHNMAYSTNIERQRYSQALAAYTLIQFSAARSHLDQHKAAADKLPAINSYDYRTEKHEGRTH